MGGNDGLDEGLAHDDFGRRVLRQGESFQVFQVEEQVRDSGDVGDVEIDQGQVAQVKRRSRPAVFRQAPEGDAFEVLQPERMQGGELLEGRVVEVVHIEVGDAEVSEGWQPVEDAWSTDPTRVVVMWGLIDEDVSFKNTLMVGCVQQEGGEGGPSVVILDKCRFLRVVHQPRG